MRTTNVYPLHKLNQDDIKQIVDLEEKINSYPIVELLEIHMAEGFFYFFPGKKTYKWTATTTFFYPWHNQKYGETCTSGAYRLGRNPFDNIQVLLYMLKAIDNACIDGIAHYNLGTITWE